MNDISSNQNVYLQNRSKLELTGIVDVSSFSDVFIEAALVEDCIAIEGQNLKIEEFSNESGVLKVNGIVSALYYYNQTKKSRKKASSR